MHIAHYIVTTGDKLLQVYSAAFLCLSASAFALKMTEETKGQALIPSDFTPKSVNKNNS